MATWPASDTHRRPQVHERFRRFRCELARRAIEDTPDVYIQGQYVPAKCKASDGVRRIAPDTWKLRQVFGPAAGRDPLSGAVKVHRSTVVAQPLPGNEHFRKAGGGHCLRRRPALQPIGPAFNDARNLGLLQHDFRNKHCPGIASAPPGQVSSRPGMPAQEKPLRLRQDGLSRARPETPSRGMAGR